MEITTQDGHQERSLSGNSSGGNHMGRRNLRSRRRRGNRFAEPQADAGVSLAELGSKSKEELLDIAKEAGLSGISTLKKEDLARKVFDATAEIATGVLEIIDDGYGFLRHEGLRPGAGDVYVSPSQIRRFALRTGDQVMGQVRSPKDGEKYLGLLRVETVNGLEPEEARQRPIFEKLTPLFPNSRITLETTPQNLSNRLIDLLAPIGRGQRGLIVSPPKAGKTMLLKSIAEGIAKNAPEMDLMVALVGERPEEVTDMERSVEGEVFSSTFDEPVEDHTRVAELGLERAKRLAECGRDVVILLDSLTRLTRAYNLAVPTSGRTLSGGIDPVALYPPKRFFGAARKMEQGGSLTVIATCLVDTGSRMDEVIYEEFKGTGNMELHLERRLADRRIYPAIDMLRSGTRREELLLEEDTLKQVWLLRRIVSMINNDPNNPTEAVEKVLDRMKKTTSNAQFLASLNQGKGATV
jgi:transcription termination factor Rho